MGTRLRPSNSRPAYASLELIHERIGSRSGRDVDTLHSFASWQHPSGAAATAAATGKLFAPGEIRPGRGFGATGTVTRGALSPPAPPRFCLVDRRQRLLVRYKLDAARGRR